MTMINQFWDSGPIWNLLKPFGERFFDFLRLPDDIRTFSTIYSWKELKYIKRDDIL